MPISLALHSLLKCTSRLLSQPSILSIRRETWIQQGGVGILITDSHFVMKILAINRVIFIEPGTSNASIVQESEVYRTPNRTLMLIFWYQKTIFWYQKINFWYQKMCEFLISENHFLISENQFLISENHFLISKNHFLISENHFLISENRH